jgi:hypothetical protein
MADVEMIYAAREGSPTYAQLAVILYDRLIRRLRTPFCGDKQKAAVAPWRCVVCSENATMVCTHVPNEIDTLGASHCSTQVSRDATRRTTFGTQCGSETLISFGDRLKCNTYYDMHTR